MEIRENIKLISPEQGMEQLLELLEETREIPLVITGGSMTPFLVPGRDTVYLSKPEDPLRRGDIVFYRRDNGGFVLHRILRIESEGFTMLGDAQTIPEPGIRPDQIRAVATAVRRKGKLLRKGSFWWEFFRVIWLRMVPLRLPVRKVYETIKNRKSP